MMERFIYVPRLHVQWIVTLLKQGFLYSMAHGTSSPVYTLLQKKCTLIYPSLPQWPWITDPDLGSCRFCQMVKTNLQNKNDPRLGSMVQGPLIIRVVFMCTSFGEEWTNTSVCTIGLKNRQKIV